MPHAEPSMEARVFVGSVPAVPVMFPTSAFTPAFAPALAELPANALGMRLAAVLFIQPVKPVPMEEDTSAGAAVVPSPAICWNKSEPCAMALAAPVLGPAADAPVPNKEESASEAILDTCRTI